MPDLNAAERSTQIQRGNLGTRRHVAINLEESGRIDTLVEKSEVDVLAHTAIAPQTKHRREVAIARSSAAPSHISPYIGVCTMPDPVLLPNGKVIIKPAGG